MLRGKEYREFVEKLNYKIYEINKSDYYKTIVFLCIGTDRVTGDCFGPLVGYKLTPLLEECSKIDVVGTLENTVSFVNIEQKVEQIYKYYEKPCLIAIDSALSSSKEVGKIVIENSGVSYGKGLYKKAKTVGDFSIKAIVAKNQKSPRHNLEILQNTPLNLVMNLAETVANGIYEAIEYE